MVLSAMFYTSAFLLCLNVIVHTNGLIVPVNPHTCVIGAGYSGLAAARYFKQYGLNYTVFEKTKYVGGTWRFDPHIDVDEDGVPVSTSQYKYLKINSPRQTMEFDGYPFPDDTPSFVSGNCFYKYIKSFVKQFDLMENIQLRSYVKSVKRLDDIWELTYTRTDTNETETAKCDFVVVAIGQYNKPYVAKFPGLEDFEGTVIHSHDYKAPEQYKDSNVLVVGGGPSGIDIGIQLQKVANKTVHSHHFKYNEPQFSRGYVKKPDIKQFVKKGVVFNDTSYEEVEHVILATGYRMDHPFLDRSSGLLITNRYAMPLHNQIVNIREPSLMFIGISKQYINKILNAQAEYIALLIAGKFKLPSEEDMLEGWMAKHSPRNLKDINSFITETPQYFQNLTEEAGVTRLPPVIMDIIESSIYNLINDILHYRNYDFQIIDSKTFKSWQNYNVTEDRFNNCSIEDLDL